MKTLSSLIVVLLLLCTTLSAQYASLWMSNPHGTGLSFQGTIEDAVAYCEVSGSHLKTDLYITFSTKAYTGSNNSDSVELRSSFNLPQQSFITDLWLWIDKDTSIAILADRFKAQATYNNIVGARKDPALLTKTYGDYYQLNIFPFTLPGKRKIKLTYSSPLKINDSSATISLPYWFLKASASYSEKPFTVFLKEHQLWKKPFIKGNSLFTFSTVADTIFGNVLRCDIPRDSITNAQQLDIVFQQENSLSANYGEKYQIGNEGTYRFVVDPLKALGINPGKNILLLVDFDSTNVQPGYTKTILLSQIKKSLLTKFTVRDSFNIIFAAKNSPKYLSSSWLPVDSATITNIFSTNVNINTILDTVNLSGLLFEGFSYAKRKSNVHAIILFASSDEYTIIGNANALADSITKIAPTKIKFYSIDNNDSAKYYYLPNYYYYGNSYLYSLLAAKYSGTTYRIWNYPGNTAHDYYVGIILENLRWQIEYFDMNVYLQNGFTYQNYFSTGLSANNIKVLSSVSQVGKFIGSLPLYIDITGFYGGKLYSKKITMNDSDFIPADSNLNKVWANQMLSQFSNSYYTRNDQAIELSLQNRILTYWTAFLALERGQKLCDTCIGFTGGPIVNNINDKKSNPTTYEIVRAYPNPFNPSTTLRIRLPQNTMAKDVSLLIFNILGQAVKSFDVNDLNDQNERNVVWNGRDDNGKLVSSGVYLAVLTTPQKKYSVKLLLMK